MGRGEDRRRRSGAAEERIGGGGAERQRRGSAEEESPLTPFPAPLAVWRTRLQHPPFRLRSVLRPGCAPQRPAAPPPPRRRRRPADRGGLLEFLNQR